MVIDDAVLLDVLAGQPKNDILAALRGNDVFTTGCWYYRLSPSLAINMMLLGFRSRISAT